MAARLRWGILLALPVVEFWLTGARMVKRDARKGLATLCNGGGRMLL